MPIILATWDAEIAQKKPQRKKDGKTSSQQKKVACIPAREKA
jgi:hypothetical protein